MRTTVFVTLLAVVSLSGHDAAAQSCPQLDFDLTASQTSCVSNCCSAMSSCYSANGCFLSSDWPSGVAGACQVCNQTFTPCAGSCIVTTAFRNSYNAQLSQSECEPDCAAAAAGYLMATGKADACGIPDGCGGVCDAFAYCGLFVRRPELIVMLF